MNIAELKIGDKVCYQPKHYIGFYKTTNEEGETIITDKYENGMVKEIPNHTNTAIRVVYNCAGNWNDFKNYTSALTSLSDLTIGWKHN